jgi:acyl-CoA synthetase (AMP-forming)/AMP-acid ligase II
MTQAGTLVELLEANRQADRQIRYIEGQDQERSVSYPALRERALGILFHLQRMKAAPGDHMIIFLNNNEAFIDGFLASRAASFRCRSP